MTKSEQNKCINVYKYIFFIEMFEVDQGIPYLRMYIYTYVMQR